MTNNGELIENIKEGVKTFVKKVDTNGDGIISMDELKAIPSGLKEYVLMFALIGMNIGQLIYNFSGDVMVSGETVTNSLWSLLLGCAYLIFGGYVKKGYQNLVENNKKEYEKVIKNKDVTDKLKSDKINELTRENSEKDSKIQFLQWQLDQLLKKD